METLSTLNKLLSDILEEDIELHESSTMENTPGWDSSTFLSLITAIELHYGIEIAGVDAISLTSVKAIDQHLKALN